MNKTKMQMYVLPNIYGAIAFIITYSLIGYYDSGDQSHYQKYWDTLNNSSIVDAYKNSLFLLGSAEPGYVLFSYLSSIIIDKTIFVCGWNYFLTYQATKWMVKIKVHPMIIIIFFFSNFYVLVLFFAAERLKISLAIAIMAASLSKSSFLWVTSIVTHLSSILILAVNIIYKLSKVRIFKFIKSNWRIILVVTIILMPVLLYFLGDHIVAKLDAYGFGETISIVGILKVMAFGLLAAFYSKNKSIPLIISTPLLFGAALIGPERIAIFSYFVMMFYALQFRRGLNFAVLLTGIYFSYKGFEFVNLFIEHGNGFHNESTK